MIFEDINITKMLPWEHRKFKVSPPKTKEGLVSVILPTYNRIDFLKKRLDEILSQSYSNLELVIVNDGSSDGTEEYLNEIKSLDERIKVITLKNNSNNVSIPRCVGISYSEGEFITFADDDVVQYKDKIRLLLSWIGNSKISIGQRLGHSSFTYPSNIDTSQFLFRKDLYETHPYIITTHADDFVLLNEFSNEKHVIFGDVVCDYIWHDNNRTYKESRKTDLVNSKILIDNMNVINNILVVTNH